MKKNRKGVTLIELVVAVAILAVLAMAVFPVARMSVKRVKELELRYNLRVIRKAIDDYYEQYGKIAKTLPVKPGTATESGYPPNLNVLVEGVDDLKGTGKKLYFLRRIPRDPFNPNKDLKPEDTWGKRSYASDYDNPQEGEDVYDVYSLSEERALDGTYYKDW
jgi:general secretion pathway protein G